MIRFTTFSGAKIKTLETLPVPLFIGNTTIPMLYKGVVLADGDEYELLYDKKGTCNGNQAFNINIKEILRSGGIGNQHGRFSLYCDVGGYYWGVEDDVIGYVWDKIPKSLFDTILKHLMYCITHNKIK